MPISLADKKELRRLAFSDVAENSLLNRNIPCYRHLSAYISRTWRHCLFSCLPALTYFRLWHLSMKTMSARFGTGVLSYFLFLRTLLLFNLLLFVINGLFVVFPQAVHPPPHDPQVSTFTGLELLTGMGYFSQTLMFYGYYTNNAFKTCRAAGPNPSYSGASTELPVCNAVTSQTVPYNISAAYFFTIAIAFFTICIILVYSMSNSFGKNLHVMNSNVNLAVKVFCSWDFKVTKTMSVRLQSENIRTQLKVRRSFKLPLNQKVMVYRSQTFFYLLPEMYHVIKTRSKQELRCNFTTLFTTNYVTVFLLTSKITINKSTLPCHDMCFCSSQCWENFVGQELYRLLLMDFIFTVLYSFLGEFLWRLAALHQKYIRNRKPMFDIARNVLELIYGQTLTWLGVLFAPLLPAVQIIKLFVLFYMKKASLMLNCQASRKPWRASQMTTLFISLLCFPSFIGASVSVTYTIWTIKPSSGCGPFRNLTTMFQSGKLWAQDVEDTYPALGWLSWAYTHLVEKPLFLFLASGVFLIVIYIHAQVVDGQRKIIKLLEKQIENEGKDKRFLIGKLHDIHSSAETSHLSQQSTINQKESLLHKSSSIFTFFQFVTELISSISTCWIFISIKKTCHQELYQ
uniref:Transmembrane channel-like protein n=1 Tax=Sphaeramia orbicularis TaxID=375764 RepID=A0A672YH94_9TELE